MTTTYAIGPDGLTQTVTARNESTDAAPWGTGPHPYLVAGSAPLDEWTFELPAAEVLLVTDDRLIPTALRPVDADDAGALRLPRPAPDRRRGDRPRLHRPRARCRRSGDGAADGCRGHRCRDGLGCRVPVGADPHRGPAGRSGSAGPPCGPRGRADDLRAGRVQRRIVRLRCGTDRARARGRRPTASWRIAAL